MVSIFQATNATALNHVRALMRAFLAWHRERHGEDRMLIDRYVEPAAFEQELGNLPGPYVLPRARPATMETTYVGTTCARTLKAGSDWTATESIQSLRDRSFLAVATSGLLIAYHAGQPIGCVALRNLGDGICELKRMFVTCEFRGLGVGRALAARAIADARQAGYGSMRLNTSRRQTEAIQLYEKSGFTRIPAYGELAEDLKPALIFFERRL